MELKKFWNKAIEHYCTFDNPARRERFETVFIAIPEESLSKVKEKYIKEGNLTDQVIALSEKNIETIGGVTKSYYSAVKDVHRDLSNPGQYSFLRFSILVLGAFKQDNSPLRNYWGEFNSFLQRDNKNIDVVNSQNATKYINDLIDNLSKYCFINHKKTFFQLNVFGEDHSIVNVGRIKAHSVFQGRTLEKIKKSIYNLGYSDTHNIEDLNFEDIKLILEDSNQTRILGLFNRGDNAKEIVHVCLKIWLKNWHPQQEEKVKLLEGKPPSKKSKLSILRIWTINADNKIELKYGFIYRFELGDDSIFYLNEDDNVYVDTSWGVKLNDSRILYVIENYSEKTNFNNNGLSLEFTKCDIDLTETEYALEKVPIHTPHYFIELKERFVKINNNPILLASKNDVDNQNAVFFHKFSIANQEKIGFKLYRINDSFESKKFSFLKINNLEITPIGISDGRPGVKSFLSSFPIIIKYNNLTKGLIQLICNDEIIKEIELYSKSNDLDTEKEVGLLKPGKYSIKYFDEIGKCLLFMNGKQTVDFEIVEAGIKDRRTELSNPTDTTFKYHEFRRFKENVNLEDSFLILYKEDTDLVFQEEHTFFYFNKNENNVEWFIQDNRNYFFLQRLKFIPSSINEKYYNHWLSFIYLSKDFQQYKYKISVCERPETLALPFNIKDFYQRNEFHRITSKNINVNCYYFRLEEIDEGLQEKYSDVKKGDVIYIISNKSHDGKPENLLKLVNQEFFPFKK